MKYLKKVLCAALACMLLAGLFVTPAFAFGCNTSDGKEGFSNGGFGSSRTRVSYDALSELCLQHTQPIAACETMELRLEIPIALSFRTVRMISM